MGVATIWKVEAEFHCSENCFTFENLPASYSELNSDQE